MFRDRPAFDEILKKGLAFKQAEHIEEKLELCRRGYFSKEMLEAMISGGESYYFHPTPFLWKCMLDNHILSPTLESLKFALCDQTIDLHRLQRHLLAETFLNLFAPPSGLMQRYSDAIVAIDGEKDGVECRGSGFLVRREYETTTFLVTCRHNVDPAQSVRVRSITTAKGENVPVGSFTMDENHDIAVMPVESTARPVFVLGDSPEIFDEVYTLGYPYLPGAMSALVGHKGELNGFTQNYLQRSPIILISNLVSPGSSGCPVLSREGFCVGMTTTRMEGLGSDGNRTGFSAALPAWLIKHALDQKY